MMTIKHKGDRIVKDVKNIKKSFSDKELAKLKPIADKVMSLEDKYKEMPDQKLHNMTKTFKILLNEGKSLDDILPDAFATVREVAYRLLGKKPYYVQVLGGIALHKGYVAEMATGEGKACPDYTPLPTPDGWKVVGDIKVGDYIFARNGKPTKVIGVYPQGEIPVYEVVLKDGRKVECGPEHRWTVYDNRGRTQKVLTTEEMFSNFKNVSRGYKYSIPTADAAEYSEKRFKIDPYVMGVFLGNGCKNTNGYFELSSDDEPCVNEIGRLINAKPKKSAGNNYTWHFGDNGYCKRIRELDPIYEDLLSHAYCHEKYIPNEYKLGSVDQRYALIQGLLDTDGNIYEGKDPNGMRYSIQYWTCSEKLRDDFIEVMNSLGYSCTWGTGHKDEDKKHFQYVVHVNVPNEDKPKLFRLNRKLEIAKRAASLKKRKDYSKIAIVDIIKTDKITKQTCFTVEDSEHLFLVGNYVATHNTLTETMPVYLNALTGNGVHVVTVNDYLAKRDSEEMGKIYNFLELTVGLVTSEIKDPNRKKRAYNCDITYGTNNEFGFDYLRDNMAKDSKGVVQRGHHYAIVDEIDSILIDEARTPLIISGSGDQYSEIYEKVANLVRTMTSVTVIETESGEMEHENSEADYIIHEKKRIATLTPHGIQTAEKFLGVEDLTSPENALLFHLLNQSIKAFGVMTKNIDYVVKDDEVMIVDEFTGRLMKGRQFNEGLHQAIQAKERVEVSSDSETCASVTFQNYFRMYNKLAGMTGTAITEKDELYDIYDLNVIAIPNNKPCQRINHPDKVYFEEDKKYDAIVDKIIECHKRGQPVLVGTPSVEKSELVAKKLKEKSEIKFKVLNATNHELEAAIIAQAGKLGAVTISTNMAGRGTDIFLGGNPEFLTKEALIKDGHFSDIIKKHSGIVQVQSDSENALEHIKEQMLECSDKSFKYANPLIAEAQRYYRALLKGYKMTCSKEKEQVIARGGLFVIGCERHESRRIDNQLIGRAGRQGDPGESQFYVSLEDNLMRLFGGQKLAAFLKNEINAKDDVLNDENIYKLIQLAQKNVESMHFEQRKDVFDYDIVVNEQRLCIYRERRLIMDSEDIEDIYRKLINVLLTKTLPLYYEKKRFNYDKFRDIFGKDLCNEKFPYKSHLDFAKANKAMIVQKLMDYILEFMGNKKAEIGEDGYRAELKRLLLNVIDKYWRKHLSDIDNLKKGIYLMSYGQKDSKVEFKSLAYKIYDDMLDDIRLTYIVQSFAIKKKNSKT